MTEVTQFLFLLTSEGDKAQKRHLSAAPSTESSLSLWEEMRCPLLPTTGECWESILLCVLQEDKLITVPSVVTPAQSAGGQDVGCGSTVIAAVTLKSIILTLALYEGKDGVLLRRWWQGLGGRQNQVNKMSQNISQVDRLNEKMSCQESRWISIKSSPFYVVCEPKLY